MSSLKVHPWLIELPLSHNMVQHGERISYPVKAGNNDDHIAS